MMRPRILAHIIDNESKSETLGFLIFLVGAARVLKNPIDEKVAVEFFWAMVLSSVLVGGKMVAKSIIEIVELKLSGAKPKEVAPNAAVPASPAVA